MRKDNIFSAPPPGRIVKIEDVEFIGWTCETSYILLIVDASTLSKLV
jgi:hypothetical protein